MDITNGDWLWTPVLSLRVENLMTDAVERDPEVEKQEEEENRDQ